MNGYGLSRRHFLSSASLMGAATLLGLPTSSRAAEPPPETKRIRLIHFPATCLAPQYLAEHLLRLEGFSEIEYVDYVVNTSDPRAFEERVDMWGAAAPSFVHSIGNGSEGVALAGIHAGCYELFGHRRVHAIRDLRGSSVSVSTVESTEHVFVSSMAAYVGVDPAKEIRWLTAGSVHEAMQKFIERKADAFLGFAPQPQELRAKRIGHVIVNTTQDRPWSQYFCCLIAGQRRFVDNYPIATKRAVRAWLKAIDICAQEPEMAARFMVSKGYEPRYETALEILKGLPYRRWRDADPEDTIRFHALRLHEVGMVKTDPKKLIARGTDWRFLNELKKELKA